MSPDQIAELSAAGGLIVVAIVMARGILANAKDMHKHSVAAMETQVKDFKEEIEKQREDRALLCSRHLDGLNEVSKILIEMSTSLRHQNGHNPD
ncbi:MAG: hypothetical protein ACXABY_12955 [Candidatus Thorarchaeota archaeon]